MPQNIRLFSDVGAKMSMFDNKAKQHKQNQMINPFSDWDGSGTRRKLSRDDPDYGKPVEGSKTAERGRQAQLQMISDMVELCDLIFDCGMRSPDGRGAICFGDVFRLYSQINDKCVGLLMRGRKHNILDFEGEMLFQRRDDDKMIELLLPLNTIRYKYGMPERAGCGEVRLDLLDELERQQREKQPPRSRSMEQLGLPPPQLHKSRSMELARDTARDDHGWQLTAESPDAAGRMGRSAENLTQIVEDEGAVGGVFTAVPEGAVGAATEEATRDVSEGARDTTSDSERGKEAVSGEVQVTWELNSDDGEEEQVEDMQGRTTETVPVTWPDVKIVVEEDVDLEGDVSLNDGQAKENNEEKGGSDEEVKENEIVQMTVGEASDQASLSDAASPAPESETDFDFWTNTEQDFWSSADDNDNSWMKSAIQTPRTKTPQRTPSPSLSEADRTVEGPATTDDDLDTKDTRGENATSGVDKQSDDISGKVASDQPETERNAFSFWDVTDENEKIPEDAKDGQPLTSLGDTSLPDRHIEKDDGFSFWDTAEDGVASEKAPEADEAENTSGEMANDCSVQSVAHHGAEEETWTAVNVTNNKDLDESGCSAATVAEGTDNDVPATNGEVFSFWDVSDEETEHTPVFRRSKPDRRDDDDTAEVPAISKAVSDSPDEATSVDITCCGRLPSPTGDEWDASSAEHPCHGDRVGASPQPLTAPHTTRSDDSELMPAR